MTTQIQCPTCKGEGKINKPIHRRESKANDEKIAKSLRKKGFSIREIMKLMKYKSSYSVTYLLNK